MSIESEARRAAVDIASNAIETLVSAHEREAARKRVEGCTDWIEAEGNLRALPRWRWLARAIWRVKARRSKARCDARRAKGDPVAHCMCVDARRRGLV